MTANNETAPKDFNKTRFGVETNLLFINVFPSEVEILNHPKNETHASDIIILVVFKAQSRTHLKILTLDHRNDPSHGLGKLSVN
ncbi:hypothetical protein E8E15_001930 [Penicillium rubens]|nr:hypothetical protein E8E15_001930 [Penicillium rubens]